MSCHYSCLTCTSNIYENLCLTCPTNRYLLDSQCFCSSGFYQNLTAQCSTSLSYFQTIWQGVQIGLYYWIIFIFWLSVIFSLNHIYSPKARILISFAQLIALLNQYKYRFSYISQKCLDALGVLNFSYLNNLFCFNKKSKPYSCESYQNIIGPLLVISAFLLAYVVSFLITKCCIFSVINGQGSNKIIIRAKSTKNISEGVQLSLYQYFQMSFSSFFLLFLDYSIVSITIQIFKIIQIGYATFLLLIPIAVFLVVFIIFHLKKVNSQKQFNIGYRSQYGYFYLYDENYHLTYIDHLFYEQKLAKQYLYKPSRFYPNSNFLVIEIGFKFLIAALTILLFQFKPQLIVYTLMAFLLVVFYCMEIFQIYQRLCLLFYLLCSTIYITSISIFYLDDVFEVFILVCTFFFSFFISLFVIVSLSAWNRSRQGKYLKKAFQSLASSEEGSEINKPSMQNIDIEPLSMQESQQDLVPAGKTKISKFNGTHTLYTKKVSTKQFGASNNKLNRQSQNQLNSVKNSLQQTKQKSLNKFGISQTAKQKSVQRTNNLYNQDESMSKQKQTLYSKMSRRNKIQKEQEMFVLEEKAEQQNQNSAQDSQKPLELKKIRNMDQNQIQKQKQSVSNFQVKSKLSSRKLRSQKSQKNQKISNIFQNIHSRIPNQDQSQKKVVPQINELIRQQEQEKQ